MPYESCDAYFFDCDGVLLDSNSMKVDALGSVLQSEGHDSDFIQWALAEFKANFGRSRTEHFEVLECAYYQKYEEKKNFFAEANGYTNLVANLYSQCPIILENAEVFSALANNGARVFVVSGSDQDELKNVLASHFGEWISTLVFGGPVSKAENISSIVSKYDLRKAVLFGDALNDLSAAKYCDIGFVGLLKYSLTAAALKNACRDHNYTHWQTLTDWGFVSS